MSEPYVANTLTSVFKANGILFPLYVDPLKLIIFVCNRSAFLTALQKNVVISVQRSSACRPQVALFCRLVRALVNMTWFLSVLSALIHSSSCMHSCDVSLCVGSRGAWSEVHVGQYGSSVVMTIILLKCAVQKEKRKKVNWCTWGCSFALLHQSLVSFALHGRAVVTVGLNCYDHQKDVVISKVFFHQSGHSPKIIRAGLERTDSQTVGEFPSRRRKGRYTTLNCCASEYFSFCDLFTLYFILILCML